MLQVTKYTCPHCDYQSIQSTAFKNHLASKHPGKSGTHFCTDCPFRSVNETALYEHQRGHLLLSQQNGGNIVTFSITSALLCVCIVLEKSEDTNYVTSNVSNTVSSQIYAKCRIRNDVNFSIFYEFYKIQVFL